jgi:two-component system response regulator NreC
VEQQSSDVRTVLVAGRDGLARKGLRSIIEEHGGFVVVADVPVRSAAELAAADPPDIAVLATGVDSASDVVRFRAAAPNVVVVVVGASGAPAEVREALRVGADAYVLRDSALDDLVLAVHAVAGGARYLSPSLGATLLAARDGAAVDSDLTVRQCDILRFLALGHTNAEVARKLAISPRTVESHRAHIQQRLGVSSRAELVREALQRNLLTANGEADSLEESDGRV